MPVSSSTGKILPNISLTDISSDPDGLEWSMEQVAETSELEAEGDVYEIAGQIHPAVR